MNKSTNSNLFRIGLNFFEELEFLSALGSFYGNNIVVTKSISYLEGGA